MFIKDQNTLLTKKQKFGENGSTFVRKGIASNAQAHAPQENVTCI